jgi:hypothetical protein
MARARGQRDPGHPIYLQAEEKIRSPGRAIARRVMTIRGNADAFSQFRFQVVKSSDTSVVPTKKSLRGKTHPLEG